MHNLFSCCAPRRVLGLQARLATGALRTCAQAGARGPPARRAPVSLQGPAGRNARASFPPARSTKRSLQRQVGLDELRDQILSGTGSDCKQPSGH